jgi:nucleotide-binding universal stress UspA family protein
MRYLVAIDGWEPSERALAFAAEQAEESDSFVHVVHVVGEDGGNPDANEQIADTAEAVLGEYDVDHETHFLRTNKRTQPANRVGKRILEFVADRGVDVVYLGNEQTGTAERMIVGSVAQKVIDDRSVPVTLVP